MLRLFQDSFIFGEGTSSHLIRPTASTPQLLFQSSCFFEELLLQNRHSSQHIFSQNDYFFRASPLPSSHFLRLGSSLGQSHYKTATFLTEGIFRIKISIEELLFRTRYFCTASTFSDELHFGKKTNFSEKHFSALPNIFGQLPF